MNIKKTVLTVGSLMILFLLAGCGSTDSGNQQGELFDSGNIGTDQTFSFTFTDEGEFEYFCRIHDPNMQGRVTVSAGAQSSNPDTVEMINNQFNPLQITVAPNTEVVWINRDTDTDHTVTSGNPTINSDPGY